MKDLSVAVAKKAEELLTCGAVSRVLGWKKGEFDYDPSPAVFESVEELKDFVYADFCGANLSKYLIQESKKAGKIAVFLKPCDTFSFNQLLAEHRIARENVYPVAVECRGMLDARRIEDKTGSFINAEVNGETVTVHSVYGDKEVQKGEVLIGKCTTCKGFAEVKDADKVIINEQQIGKYDRFSEVEKLEKMSASERFAFWQNELSKCIRCNACRNVCPACSCTKCVFDNPKSGISTKASADTFEEQNYHIIRAFHVAGRCTDCGECSRVCPERIPLHLLNRKFIKDIDNLYGDYQAGASDDNRSPLTSYTEGDKNPAEAVNTEGVKNA